VEVMADQILDFMAGQLFEDMVGQPSKGPVDVVVRFHLHSIGFASGIIVVEPFCTSVNSSTTSFLEISLGGVGIPLLCVMLCKIGHFVVRFFYVGRVSMVHLSSWLDAPDLSLSQSLYPPNLVDASSFSWVWTRRSCNSDRFGQPMMALKAEGMSITTNCPIRVLVVGFSPSEFTFKLVTECPSIALSGFVGLACNMGSVNDDPKCSAIKGFSWPKMEANPQRWRLDFRDGDQPSKDASEYGRILAFFCQACDLGGLYHEPLIVVLR
uniref:Uncharacterized protein n=1 Tax=Cannabis sativa TaxID=3483 RepID=A0A803QSE7_CANSA